MKIVIRTLVFHLFCIVIFSFLYLYFSHHFISTNEDKHNKKKSIVDFILLGTTIQAGVGVSDLYPISSYVKFIMIIQQILMIMTHVFTLYIFTL